MFSKRLTSVLSLLLITGATAAGCSDDTDDDFEGPRGGRGGSGGTAGAAGEAGEAGASGSGAGERGDGGTSATGGTSAGGTNGGSTNGEAGAGNSSSGGAGAGGAGSGGTDGGASGSSSTAGEGGVAGEAGSGGAGGSGAEALPSASPAELTDESDDDYANNEHGIITGDTLADWIANWQLNRPPAATGKLVVLQIAPNVASSVTHVAPNGADVVSYLVPASELTQVRDNGLSRIEAEIPDGPSADAFVKKYGIDVLHDYVVFTFEQLPSTQNSIVQSVGRAWLLLRYWGYPKERLAILNGSIDWNAAAHGLVLSTDAAPTPPNDGTASVRDLRVDNTAYVVTLSDLLTILKDEDEEAPRANVSVVDARGGAEALGLLKATSSGKTDCPSYTGTGVNSRCSPPFEGRIKGAHSVPWPQFIDSPANGFQFFPKAVVKSIFDDQAEYQPGQLTIQYCRTNMRSMVTGIVANVILGYPTRFYDTSFIEWSHLAYGPTPRTQILSVSSPYRTDLPSLTEHANVENYVPGGSIEGITILGWVDGPNYNAEADISLTPPLVTPTATTTNLSVDTDRAYKLD